VSVLTTGFAAALLGLLPAKGDGHLFAGVRQPRGSAAVALETMSTERRCDAQPWRCRNVNHVLLGMSFFCADRGDADRLQQYRALPPVLVHVHSIILVCGLFCRI